MSEKIPTFELTGIGKLLLCPCCGKELSLSIDIKKLADELTSPIVNIKTYFDKFKNSNLLLDAITVTPYRDESEHYARLLNQEDVEK